MLGVNGASGQIYGSNVSLQSFRNSDSSGSTRSNTTTTTKNNDRRRRSSSTGTSVANNWNRKYPIPKIRTDSYSGGSKNASSSSVPTENNNHEHILEDDGSGDKTHVQVAPRQRSASHDGRHPDLIHQVQDEQVEDVENVIDDRNHIPQGIYALVYFTMWVRKLKKVQTKKLVKSNKSILREIFFNIFHENQVKF